MGVDDDEDNSSFGAGEIVGICLAVLLVIAICVGIAYWKRVYIKGYFDNRKHMEKGVHMSHVTSTSNVDLEGIAGHLDTTVGDVKVDIENGGDDEKEAIAAPVDTSN